MKIVFYILIALMTLLSLYNFNIFLRQQKPGKSAVPMILNSIAFTVCFIVLFLSLSGIVPF